MNKKVAIVTGAAQGIGYAAAKRFANAGVRVVLADLSENCRSVAEALCSNGADVIGIPCNVASQAEVSSMIEQTLAHYGRVDVLINNAGITKDARLHKMRDEDWDRVLSVNLSSMFYTCKKVIPYMIENGGGSIVNVSSISALRGNFGQANYNASKMGVIGLTRTICTEYAKSGIRCNAVAPGLIQTDMLKTIPDQVLSTYIDQVPAKRAGAPEEVANVIYFLASDEASFVNGQLLSVNGGQHYGI